MAIASKVTKLNGLLEKIKTCSDIVDNNTSRLKEVQADFNNELYKEVKETHAKLDEQYNMGLHTTKDYFTQLASVYKDAQSESFEIEHWKD